MVEKIVNLMGGEVYYQIDSNCLELEKKILKFMIKESKILVNKFNFYDPNSLLSQLNFLRSIKYDDDLAFLLSKSIYFFKLSEGKFNIFKGKEIMNRKNNLNSNNKNLNTIITNKNINSLISINDDFIKINKSDIIIDMGGIAKGYIIDKVLELTYEKYSKDIIDCIIDARGDIIFSGKSNKIFEVENPFNIDYPIYNFEIKQGSIITSGHNKQNYLKGSHIVGYKSDILTITLQSNSKKTYELDALGTYLIQLSSYDVMEILEFDKYFEDIKGILVLENGDILNSI